MKKDGVLTAREAFQNGICLVCFSITVSIWALDTIYEMDKMEDYLDKAFAYGSSIVTSRTRLEIRACFWLLFLLSFFPSNEDMRNAAQPWGRNAGQKKRENNFYRVASGPP
jgi:hypothetical protein